MSRESKAIKDEIQRNRDEAYLNGWNDGYAEGHGKATADAPTFTAADLERAMKEGMRIATTVPTEKVAEAFAAALAAFDKTYP